MRTGSPVGVECAIRWQHPVQGRLHATKFVDDVTPAGLAREYMRFIVGSATRQMARWRAASVPFGRASVNAWPGPYGRDLIDDTLPAASKAGISPADIEIESQPEASYGPPIFAALREFRDAGLRVALDDFGTVIAACVGFARSIGAETVAEGVETTAIRDRVRELGCEIGQGFLWSQQVPGDELPSVISAIRIDGAASPKP